MKFKSFDRRISILDWVILVALGLLFVMVYLPQSVWKEENKHEMGAHHYSLEEFGLESSFIDDHFKDYINQYIK